MCDERSFRLQYPSSATARLLAMRTHVACSTRGVHDAVQSIGRGRNEVGKVLGADRLDYSSVSIKGLCRNTGRTFSEIHDSNALSRAPCFQGLRLGQTANLLSTEASIDCVPVVDRHDKLELGTFVGQLDQIGNMRWCGEDGLQDPMSQRVSIAAPLMTYLDLCMVDAVLDDTGAECVVQTCQDQRVRRDCEVDELPFRAVDHPAVQQSASSSSVCLARRSLGYHPSGLLSTGPDDALLGEGEQARSDELAAPVDLAVIHPCELVGELARLLVRSSPSEQRSLGPKTQRSIESLVDGSGEVLVARKSKQLLVACMPVVARRIGARGPRDLAGLHAAGVRRLRNREQRVAGCHRSSELQVGKRSARLQAVIDKRKTQRPNR